MNFKNISLFLSFFLLFHRSNAFNITSLLAQYPEFSTFNNYLTQTQVAGDINGRQTITVLAVDNTAMAPVSGKPADVLKKIMMVHVVLDYYDVPKLQKLPNSSSILTTLFQASGQATGQQGFLNVSDVSTGAVVFRSAAHSSTLGANLVKSIASQPFNISVLQISNAVMPIGVDGSNSSTSPVAAPGPGKSVTLPPSTSPQKSPTTAPPMSSKAPAPSRATTPAAAPPDEFGEAPVPSDANAGGPASDAPTVAEVPAGSPPMPADGPIADAPAADAPTGSAGARLALRLSLSVVMIIVSWILYQA